MTPPIQLTVEVDLDAYLARYGPTINEDGDRQTEPVTIEDVVIDQAARALLTDATQFALKDEWGTLRRRINEVTVDAIREAVAPLIAEALTRAVQPTNQFGEQTGSPVTLTERIVAAAEEQLRRPDRTRSSFDRSPKTTLEELVAEATSSAVRKELAGALEAGKAEVKAALQQQGAALLAETITRTAQGAMK